MFPRRELAHVRRDRNVFGSAFRVVGHSVCRLDIAERIHPERPSFVRVRADGGDGDGARQVGCQGAHVDVLLLGIHEQAIDRREGRVGEERIVLGREPRDRAIGGLWRRTRTGRPVARDGQRDCEVRDATPFRGQIYAFKTVAWRPQVARKDVIPVRRRLENDGARSRRRRGHVMELLRGERKRQRVAIWRRHTRVRPAVGPFRDS